MGWPDLVERVAIPESMLCGFDLAVESWLLPLYCVYPSSLPSPSTSLPSLPSLPSFPFFRSLHQRSVISREDIDKLRGLSG